MYYKICRYWPIIWKWEYLENAPHTMDRSDASFYDAEITTSQAAEREAVSCPTRHTVRGVGSPPPRPALPTTACLLTEQGGEGRWAPPLTRGYAH